MRMIRRVTLKPLWLSMVKMFAWRPFISPNGNPPYNDPDDTSKFAYKLRWMEALF